MQSMCSMNRFETAKSLGAQRSGVLEQSVKEGGRVGNATHSVRVGLGRSRAS